MEQIPHTVHRLVLSDAQDLSFVSDGSVHLVVTSPPYWTLKQYRQHPEQLGHIADYEAFLAALNCVWRECFRLLVPGGRLVCIVGDVCLSRRRHGRHVVVPLHADICVMCRKLGFDKPNAIIKNDIEFILMQRKPGGYRKPTEEQRRLSKLTKDEFSAWFQQFWRITGASTKNHPAPFPLELAYRLVRMFSFVGDTVLDPFLGTGTTSIAAMRCGRNSIGVEIDETYLSQARRRAQMEANNLFSSMDLQFEEVGQRSAATAPGKSS